MRINTNVSALNAQRNLSNSNAEAAGSMAKLSSGFRINRAADDAAGLGIANKLRADTRALGQASRNAEQANSLLQVADGATGTIQKMLERMKELATQSASDNTDGDATSGGRQRIQSEFTELKAEITRTVDTTKFQGKTLLNGSFGNTVNADDTVSTALASASVVNAVKTSGAAAGTYTVTNGAAGELTMTSGGVSQTVAAGTDGRQNVSFDKFGITLELEAGYDSTVATNTMGDVAITQGASGGTFMIGSSGQYSASGADNISLSSLDLSLSTLGINADTLTTAAGARTALTNIDTALGKVASAQGEIGAKQNRIENAMSNLKTSIQNFSAAESVIRDVDMAEEMTKFSKNNILSQAGTAMLAQANQSSQGVLQLLRG
jgi:flagellin